MRLSRRTIRGRSVRRRRRRVRYAAVPQRDDVQEHVRRIRMPVPRRRDIVLRFVVVVVAVDCGGSNSGAFDVILRCRNRWVSACLDRPSWFSPVLVDLRTLTLFQRGVTPTVSPSLPATTSPIAPTFVLAPSGNESTVRHRLCLMLSLCV